MRLGNVALVLLASGLSRRFGGDKLMADYRGAPLLSHAAGALEACGVADRIAVAGANQPNRSALLRAKGWKLIDNPCPEAGQGGSLSLGVRAALDGQCDAVMVLLGDMPDVPDTHLSALAGSLVGETQAVITASGGTLSPPAIFQRNAAQRLVKLEGDRGARGVFEALSSTTTLPLDAKFARDVDTPADLMALEEVEHER